MKAKATILLKQLTAGFLLLLFMFIHGVKCFHHHAEQPLTAKQSVTKVVVKSGIACAICDYHFLKDADAVASFAVVQPLLIHLSATPFYILPSTTSIGLPSADRGPPTLI